MSVETLKLILKQALISWAKFSFVMKEITEEKFA